MKKITSVLLILTMLLSIVCVNSSAAEGMLMQSNFSSEETTLAQFALGDYYCEPSEGMIIGYNSARALQTRYDDEDLGLNPYGWETYDLSVTMALAVDDLATGERAIHLTHCNTALLDAGLAEGTCYMGFSYMVDTGEFYLSAGSLGLNQDEGLLAGPYAHELVCDGSEFFTLGLSISENRMRGFLNGELILEYVDTEGYYMLGNDHPNPQVIWNDNNMVMIKDYKVSSAGFMFPLAPETSETEATETTQGGENDVTTTETKETSETTTKIESSVVTNGDGETEIVTQVVTEATTTKAPEVADTNTNKPAGGSSTATGDSAFVVVVAMVAALGSALIVRKVNVK